jgi:hypothetical protein
MDIKQRLSEHHGKDLRAAIEGGYDSDPIYTDALDEIERLEHCIETWLTAESEWCLERERLEGELAAERKARGEERQGYDVSNRISGQVLADLRDRLLAAECALAACREEAQKQRSAKNQARADLLKVSERLNAYTDRMITAGLMS